ncbi:MAG TPA: hypothetical protein VGM62_16005 [Chthoniobacterales bacterium]|jgi:hypothetical protein
MIDALIRDFRQPEYLHVLLNPLPIYGLAVGLLGLFIALILRSRHGQIATLAIILFSAGMAWPVFELGERSYDRVLSMSDEDGRAWLAAHQHRADRLIYFFYALAIVSLAAIVVPMIYPRSSLGLVLVTLLLGFVVLGMGAYIARAGGKIRHREFRNGPPPKVESEQRNSSD